MDTPSDMSLTPSTPNPNPAQAMTSLSAQSSNLFQNAAGFNIIGGQFISGEVHNHPIDPGPVKAQGNLQPSPGGTSLSIPSFNLLDDSFSESEIYCNQLMRRRRGFPLYVPGPPENLPEEYRRNGVAIGDVGSITPEGIFDFYFNVYLPADHPINHHVPESFDPLPPYASEDLTCLSYDPGDSVSTSSVAKLTPPSDEFGGADFVFSCDAPQGAVLALPYGARLNKLNNLELVREYVATQAQSWYEHINGARGRGLENGSLYLVTGWEKAHSWGMASFYGTTDEFQLELRESRRADSSRRFQWSGVPGCRDPSKHKSYDCPTSSILSNQTTFIHGLSISLGAGIWGTLFGTKVGISDIVESQLGSANDNGRASRPSASSLFSSILGFLGGGGSTGGRSHADGDHPPQQGVDDHVERPENAFLLFRRSLLAPTSKDLGSSSADSPPLSANAQGKKPEAPQKTASQQWTALSPEERAHWKAQAEEKQREHELLYPNYVYRPRRIDSNVVLSDLPPIVKIFHPAEVINNYILAKAPEATVVMSHDDDWSDILADSPNTGLRVQTVSELLDRLNNEFSIEEKDGATFLQRALQDDYSPKEPETFAVGFDMFGWELEMLPTFPTFPEGDTYSDDDGSLLTPRESSALALEEESDSPLFGGSALVFGAGAKQSGTVTKSDVSSHPAWAEYGYQEMSVDARSRSPGASTRGRRMHEDEQDSSAMEE